MIESLMRRVRRRRMTKLKSFGQARSEQLHITFGDLDAHVADRLCRHFHDVAEVEVVRGNLLDANVDAVVSPANSFGDMGGGIDKAIDEVHRGEAQRLVMAAIAERFLGELPVGSALVVEMPSRRPRFVVAAPTMRVPGSVQGSINPYLSMRAALVAIMQHNATSKRPIRSLAVPGLGTGVGGVDPGEAAEQMRAAYDSVVGGKWRDVVHAALAPFALRGSGRTSRGT